MTNKGDELFRETFNLVEEVLFSRVLHSADGIQNKESHDNTEELLSNAKEEAIQIANSGLIKSKICAGIKNVTDNIKEITKIVVASLLPLSLIGTITLPLTPILLTAVVLIILDSGIAVYCSSGNLS